MRRLSLLLAATLAACGTSGTTDTVDPTSEAPVGGHTAASATTATSAKGVSELFVQEDPTLDVTASAAQNAQDVQTQVQGKLSTSCPGASVQLDAATATVTVDFGSSCTLPNLGAVSGSVSAAISKPGARQVQVAFTFSALQVNGLDVAGTLTASTSDDASFTVNSNLTGNADTLVLNGATFTLDSGGGGATLSGSATLTTATMPTPETLKFNAVHHTFGACYADSGSIAITKTATTRGGHSIGVTETVTFSSTTPTTGQAELSVGSAAPIPITLPTHGACGSSATDAG
jgi:hypothetical protein